MGRPRKVIPTCGGPKPKDGTGDKKLMAELLGKAPHPQSPVCRIYLLHQQRPEGHIGIWYRLIRENSQEITGWLTPDDAELVEATHPEAVQWLSKLSNGEEKRRRSANGSRRNFSAEDRVTHH